MSLQFSYYVNSTHLRTFGRPDQIVNPPGTGPSSVLIAGVRGAADGSGGSTTTFVHPGVLLGLPQLDFVKGKLAASAQPWTGEYAKLLASRCDLICANNNRLWSDLSWAPTPRAVVGRGVSSGTNAEGDQDLQADAIAAYTQALIWYYTGSRAAAVKSIQLLNAWSAVLTQIKFSLPDYSDGLLHSAWCGSMLPRAAEIMRYTFTPAGAEPALDVTNAIRMFRDVFIPRVKDGWTGGGVNWLHTMCEALMACSVFNDDLANFRWACDNWRLWSKSTMFKTGDVNQWAQLAGSPISPRLQLPNQWGVSTVYDRASCTPAQMKNYWYAPTSYINGLQGEMLRDPWHMAMGYASVGNAAETARLQGVDLFGEEQTRIVASTELACKFVNSVYLDGVNPPVGWPGAANGSWGTRATDYQRITWSLLYNHYALRLGVAMPETNETIQNYVAATGYRAALHVAHERLTHWGAP